MMAKNRANGLSLDSCKLPALSRIEGSVVSCKLKNALTEMFPYLFGKRLTDHVLVNNWANGWSFDSVYGERSRTTQDKLITTNHSQPTTPTTIYIVFWPQILEFLGFALVPLPFLWILRKKSHST